MEFKVKEVGAVEEKSAAQVEETLIEKVEQQHEQQPQAVEQTTVPEETQGTELREEDVLGYIKNRYDKDISSVDDLFAERESNEELPPSTEEKAYEEMDPQDLVKEIDEQIEDLTEEEKKED